MNIKIIILHNIRKLQVIIGLHRKFQNTQRGQLTDQTGSLDIALSRNVKILKKNENKTKKIAENHKLKAKILDKVKGIFNFLPNF